MTDIEIQPITNGISFMQYLGEIFKEHGEDLGKMLCENKFSFETARTLTFDLEDAIGNKHQLEITLKDMDDEDDFW